MRFAVASVAIFVLVLVSSTVAAPVSPHSAPIVDRRASEEPDLERRSFANWVSRGFQLFNNLRGR
ncbi:hypothetical protein FRC18_002327 [Serendipita sp. 400]|nr:hypothetical protein FRC18_002327 [Serendipita sp. 400]